MSFIKMINAQNSNRNCWSISLQGYPSNPDKGSRIKVLNVCDSALSKVILFNDLNPFFKLHLTEILEKNKYYNYNPDPSIINAGFKAYNLENVKYTEIKPLLNYDQEEVLKNYSFTTAITYRNQGILKDSIAWMNATLSINAIPPDSKFLLQVSLSSYIILINAKGDTLYSVYNQNYAASTPLIISSDSLIAYSYYGYSYNHNIIGIRIENFVKKRIVLDFSRSSIENEDLKDWIDYKDFLITGTTNGIRIIELLIYNKKNGRLKKVKLTGDILYNSFEIFEDKLQVVKYSDGEDSYRENFKEIDLNE
jgi:hypothetical protein